MTGIKHDAEKPAMDLLPMAALTEVAKVLTAGAKKYASHNWRQGFAYSRLQAAMLRHYAAFSEGENFDDETKLPHLAHMACCVLFLLEHQLKGYGVDDRYTTSTGLQDHAAKMPKAKEMLKIALGDVKWNT